MPPDGPSSQIRLPPINQLRVYHLPKQVEGYQQSHSRFESGNVVLLPHLDAGILIVLHSAKNFTMGESVPAIVVGDPFPPPLGKVIDAFLSGKSTIYRVLRER